MRLNRGTIILLAASIVVIVAVLVLNNNQADAPEVETPVNVDGGPLFADLTADAVVSLSVKEMASESFIHLTRAVEADSAWVVTGPADSDTRIIDQDAATQVIADLVALAANSSFEIDSLADFGLDSPAFIIEVATGATALDIVYVGNKNPAGNRYYVMTRQMDVTGEQSSPDLAVGNRVLLVNTNALNGITDLISDPPFVPLPTATPPATATLNPLSEVEIATVTAEAAATATAEMEAVLATIAAQPEVTAEATQEPE